MSRLCDQGEDYLSVFTRDALPQTCLKLIPVPDSMGVIIIAADAIIYIDDSSLGVGIAATSTRTRRIMEFWWVSETYLCYGRQSASTNTRLRSEYQFNLSSFETINKKTIMISITYMTLSQPLGNCISSLQS
ncbi:unnamed protein product [Rhizophagus irregularis]|nr:unnamed protein product [Rhizophagus irregularis]